MKAPWVIVTGDFRTGGGQDRANLELARFLLKRGHPVHLVAHTVEDTLLKEDGAQWHRVLRPLGRHAFGRALLSRTGLRVAGGVTHTAPDAVVVVNGGNCPWPGVNWVHCVQAARPIRVARDAPMAYRLRRRVLQRVDCRDELRAFRAAKLLVVNSRRTFNDVVRLGIAPSLVETVYLGVDPRTTRLADEAEARASRAALGLPAGTLVGYLGPLGMDAGKGIDTLLEAWARLVQRGGWDACLVIGGGGQLSFWKKVAARLGIAGNIRWLGPVADARAFLLACDLFVSPTRYDSYGLAVHEALALGRPAYVSASAGVAELYPPALQRLIIKDASDPGAVADALRGSATLSSVEAHALVALGEQLRARTWHQFSAEMVNVVEERVDLQRSVSARSIPVHRLSRNG